jgi:hypothetical protein
MSFSSFVSHPINLTIFQVLITASAISFTRPSSITRPAALPLLIAATWLIAVTCLQHIPRMSLTSIVAGNGPTYLVRYIDLVLISRWSYEAGGPTNSPEPWRSRDSQGDTVSRSSSSGSPNRNHLPGTVLDRLQFGIDVTLSSRHVNTPWEVKNVPRFSASDPHYIPSRRTFLRHNAIVVLLCYIVVDVFSLGVQPESNAILFASQNIPFFVRLGNVSAQQLAIRVISTLTLGLNIYCITRLGYSILGIIAVGTGLSRASAWRPPFGRLADAYMVRHFWG